MPLLTNYRILSNEEDQIELSDLENLKWQGDEPSKKETTKTIPQTIKGLTNEVVSSISRILDTTMATTSVTTDSTQEANNTIQSQDKKAEKVLSSAQSSHRQNIDYLTLPDLLGRPSVNIVEEPSTTIISSTYQSTNKEWGHHSKFGQTIRGAQNTVLCLLEYRSPGTDRKQLKNILIEEDQRPFRCFPHSLGISHTARNPTEMEHVHEASPMHGDHGGHGDDCDSPCADMGHSHAMVFHANVCQEILFNGWLTTTALQLFGSCVAIFVGGLLYEALKYYREVLHIRATTVTGDSRVNIAKNECGSNGNCTGPTVVKYGMLSGGHLVQTALHVVQATASYVLMLVFMTYNVYLCAALVLGLGLGYFVFGWRKSSLSDDNEHCQ